MKCSKCNGNMSSTGIIKSVYQQPEGKTDYQLRWVHTCAHCNQDHIFKMSGEIKYEAVQDITTEDKNKK